MSADAGDTVVVCSVDHLTVFKGGKKAFTLPVDYGATSVAISPNKTEVAVGGKDMFIHLYDFDGATLTPKKEVKASAAAVTTVAYSPDGAWLAAGDAKRQVFAYDTTDYTLKMDRWRFHTATITALQFSPDSTQLASVSLDTNIIIWNMALPTKRITIQGAHPTTNISGVEWADGNNLLTSGYDGCVRSWKITSF